MANFNSANLTKALLMLTDRWHSAEFRQKERPVLELLQKGSDGLIDNIDKLRQTDTSKDRDIDVLIHKNTAEANKSSREHDHSGSGGDVVSTSLSFTTLAGDIQLYYGMFDDNVVTMENALARKMEAQIISLFDDLETALLSWLSTYKSQVAVAPDLVTWDSTNHRVEVAGADRLRYFDYLRAFMKKNKYRGEFDIIADQVIAALYREIAGYGSNNSQNLQTQLAGFNLAESIDLSASGGLGSAYIIPSGHTGLITSIPHKNRIGKGVNPADNVGVYKMIPDPYGLGIPIAISMYEERADGSGKNGVDQDDKVEIEFSFDYAGFMAPQSTSNAYSAFLSTLKS